MALGKYCFCYEIGVGATLIGFLQLNAMIFFWARFAQLEPYYCWLDIGVATVYTVRVTFFFIMVGLEYSLDSKRLYFDVQKWSTFPLAAVAIGITTCKWVEFGHVPTWTVVSWVLVGGFNAYHWFALKEWAEVTGDSFRPYDDVADVDASFSLTKKPKK